MAPQCRTTSFCGPRIFAAVRKYLRRQGLNPCCVFAQLETVIVPQTFPAASLEGGPRRQAYTATMTTTKIVQHSAAATLAMPNPRSLSLHTVAP